MKILFAGGGTAGHILPIIAIAREIRRLYKGADLELHYLGPWDDFGNLLLSQEGIKTKTIRAGKVRRYGGFHATLHNFIDVFFDTPVGILQAFWHIFFLTPDVLFTKGGYGAIPATIASWFLRTPIFLHESDIIPGLANRIGGFFAREVFVSFPQTQSFSSKKMILVGNPIRKTMLDGSEREAKRIFDLKGDKPLVLILGGSQGAQRINDMLLDILPEAVQYFEIIHQTGDKNFRQVREEAKVMLPNESDRAYYHIVPFMRETELKDAYAAAHFVVSRAGSGSIFEIAAFEKPSILIPLAGSAQNHQYENAYAYANTGAAVVLEESNLTPHFFLERLKYLSSNAKERDTMKTAAKNFAKPEAARIIANYIFEYLAR